MDIYTFFTLILICLLGTYLIEIQYIRYLRKERNKVIRDIDVILVSILFGAPVSFVMWCAFDEIRTEDKFNKHRMLISSVLLSIIQITIVILLFYFGIIKLATSEPPVEEETMKLIVKNVTYLFRL